MDLLRCCPSALLTLLCGLLAAQSPMPAGPLLHMTANAFSRGGAGTGQGELMQRFDADDVRGFGIDSAFPGMQVVRGVVLFAQDFGFSTPNGQITVTLYKENPLQPGYPDLANPLATVPNVTVTPPLSGLTQAWFVPPALAPIGADVFVGVRVNATSVSFGGVRLNLLYGTVQSTLYDLAGGAMPSSPPDANSYCLFRNVATNQLTYQSRGQYVMDLMTSSPSGFATAITNQANYSVSTVAPGATTMLSGLHPDAAAPPQNAGRADDVGFLYGDVGLAPGNPVIFAAAFADFGSIVPLDALVPGSIGGLCLDAAQLFPLGIAPLSNVNDASFVTTIAPAVRTALHGQFWTQQAIGFDLATGTLRGSMCSKQRF